MRKKQIILGALALHLFLGASAYAQSLTPSVICTSGGTSTGGGTTLTWTIGETMNTTLTGSTAVLTQGEQQPYLYLNLLRMKAFIQGFYIAGSGGQMTPVLYNSDPVNFTADQCDTITIELHAEDAPFDLVASSSGMMHTDGNASLVFPGVLLNKAYYVVFKHRNSIETWSKAPVMMNDANMRFDFTKLQ
jgi:hypothetical protein